MPIGGELAGIELAEFLCERGRKVTLVDDAPKLGRGLQVCEIDDGTGVGSIEGAMRNAMAAVDAINAS